MQIVRPCRARPPHSSRTGRTAKRLDNTWDLPLVDFALVACHAVVKGAVACSNGPIESVLVHVHETKMRISGQTAPRNWRILRGASLLTILARASQDWPSSRRRGRITK